MAEHIADGGAHVYIVRRIGHAYPSGEKLFTRDDWQCCERCAKTLERQTDAALAQRKAACDDYFDGHRDDPTPGVEGI